ncbi:hypothetical protein DFH27DRAFT_556824 [Peziza echinospora]|nr:hypothetical protein DFH27DRAFT_556824 [Peziza echinospora]
MESPEPIPLQTPPAAHDSSSAISECIIVRDSDSSSVITVETSITSIMSTGNNTSKPNSRAATPSSEDMAQTPTLTPDTEAEAEAVSESRTKEPEAQKTPLPATRVLRQRPSRPELAPNTPKSVKKPAKADTQKHPSPQLSDVIQIRSVSETAKAKDEGNAVRRRSTRISLLPTEIKAPVASLTPKKDTGKRTHEIMNNGSKSANAKLGSSTWGKGRIAKKAKIAEPEPESSSEESESEESASDSDEEEDNDSDEDEDEEEEEEEEEVEEVQPKKVKKWATHGLYMGQADNFDPRRRTKRGRLSGAGVIPPKRKPAMPLPMFHGLDVMTTQRDFKLPFNLFSPSAKKIHPPGWKILSRNIFVGDAREQWKSESEPTGKCVCKPDPGCDENCINRCVYYECNDENCNVGPEFCHNRHFSALKKRVSRKSKFSEGVEVIETKDRGYGLRAIRSFEPNQIIVEYCGEIISQEETDERMRKVYKNNSSYYLMLFDQSMIIDATRGSIARFVNHSCDPNCRMEKWIVDNKPRMALFAGENGIETGDELTYDYNFNWFSGVSQQICRCGAESCRGAMGKRSDGRKTIVEEKPVKVGKKKKANRIQASITVEKAKSGTKTTKAIKATSATKATKATASKAVVKATKTYKVTNATKTSKPSKAMKTRVFKVVKKTTVKKVINKKVVKKTVVKTPSTAVAPKPQPLAKTSSSSTTAISKTSVGYQRRVGKTYGRAGKTYAKASRTIKPDEAKDASSGSASGAENSEPKTLNNSNSLVVNSAAAAPAGALQRPKRTAYGTIQNITKTMSEKTGLQGPTVLDTIVLVR